MSADSGNEVPDDERLEWLLSLDDDQFKRMQKVARGPVYTRRQIAKYLGTGAAAALAGGASTGSVMAQQQAAGDVGTSSNRVNVFELNNYSSSEEGGLQAAIDAASAGDVVIFDEDETISTQVVAKSEVDIVGRSGAVLEIADGVTIGYAISTTGVSNVTIRGLTIDGNRQNVSAGGRGIGSGDANGIRNLTVKNCTVRDSRLDCVKISEQSPSTSENINIVHNRFIDYGGHGAILMSETDANAVMRNSKINGNTCQTPNSDPAAIALTFARTAGTCQNNEVNNNTINTTSSNNHDAITFEGPENCEAIGNTIDTTSNALTTTNGSTEILFGDNVVSAELRAVRVAGAGTSGVTVDGGVFESASGEEGIRIEDSATDVKLSDIDLTMTGSSNYGIRVRSSAASGDYSISNVSVKGSPSLYGIWVLASGVNIDSCTVPRCGRSGVQISADDCTVTGGRYYDNGSDGTHPYGIYLDGCSDCAITGIRAYDENTNQTHGVGGASSDNNVIVGNALRGNTTGATDSLGSNSTVANNGT